jgi:polysaccharide deacetylase family protein (PEP-CTERM system associated)
LKNLLSIDFEAWFHFLGDAGAPSFETWNTLDTRLERNTGLLLELLEGISVTFFVLGWVAERHPSLIKTISAAGHEIASHGYSHDLVFELGPKRFREDLRRTKNLLEDNVGKSVAGYRAPGFSIRQTEPWALEIICEEGFIYDSSIFPALRSLGGIDGFERFPQKLNLKAGDLIELPVSTALLWGKPVAFCGGGFFRFCPFWVIKKEIEKLNRAEMPAVVYVHPQDFDSDQPRMNLEWLHAFMYYYGLKKSVGKFNSLLRSFQWQGFYEYAQYFARI